MLETDRTRVNEKPANTTASDFVKKIGLLGCIMFTMMFILYLIVCFVSKPSLLAEYIPPQTSEYYSSHLDELKNELSKNVFPKLSEKISCEIGENTLKIYIPHENFWDARSAILDHFDAKLFEFSEITQE